MLQPMVSGLLSTSNARISWTNSKKLTRGTKFRTKLMTKQLVKSADFPKLHCDILIYINTFLHCDILIYINTLSCTVCYP